MPVQNKPIIHGRDHETDGADPIRGLLPKIIGSIEELILATEPGVYYKLNETAGDWADSVGNRDASYVPQDDTIRGVVSGYDENDGALCVTVDGPTPTAALDESNIGSATDSLFEFAGSAPLSVSARVKLHSLPTGSYSMGICGNVDDPASGAPGWGLYVLADGWISGTGAGTPCFRRSQGGGIAQSAFSPVPLIADVWYRITGTFDGTTAKLYVDKTHDTESDDATAVSIPAGGDTFHIGDCGINEGFGGNMAPFDGELDSIVVWSRALTEAEIGGIVDAGEEGGSGGEVVTVDPETGEPVWAPPGTEVEHGDGDPEENPVTNPPGPWVGSPESPSGWHYQAHYEYAVLYDSSPGRFDVPPRKWTRVPFNTVRIYRTWELEVDGDWRTAWLEDDRGLTEHAKNGLLLITPGMTFEEQTISGWYSIEYPVLNYLGLPDYTGGPFIAPDRYTRAARMISATSGQVLRWQVEPNMRAFFEWPFYDDADGDALASYWTVDNPFPIYPHWAARPLNKPLPYPKLTNAASLDYYKYNISGNPGFMLDSLEVEANLPAGHAIALQAWQDTPWLLRFGTDKYPPYTPYNYVEEFRKRPCLVIQYGYDPETIDHDTGALL